MRSYLAEHTVRGNQKSSWQEKTTASLRQPANTKTGSNSTDDVGMKVGLVFIVKERKLLKDLNKGKGTVHSREQTPGYKQNYKCFDSSPVPISRAEMGGRAQANKQFCKTRT